MLNPLRHQLPAHSPLPLAAILRWGLGRGEVAAEGGAGVPLRRLEKLLRRRYQAHGVHLLGSGTQALSAALAMTTALGSGRRNGGAPRPVALPAYSCYDLLTAALAAGCPVVYYDVDPVTLGPDLASLEEVVQRGVAGVVVASLFGFAPDWGAIGGLTRGSETVIIEDAAQGFGGSWHGSPLGSGGPEGLASLSVLSFGRGKGWTAGSGGGALLVRSPDGMVLDRSWTPPAPSPGGVAAAWSRVALAGKALALWAMARPGLYRVPRSIPWLGLGQTHLKTPMPPSAFPAAMADLLLNTLEASEQAAVARRQAGEAYADALHGSAAGIPLPLGGADPGYLRFPLLLDEGLGSLGNPDRGLRLGAESGYPRILPEVGRPLGLVDDSGREWPGAHRLVRSLLTFPTHELTRASERGELVGLVAR